MFLLNKTTEARTTHRFSSSFQPISALQWPAGKDIFAGKSAKRKITCAFTTCVICTCEPQYEYFRLSLNPFYSEISLYLGNYEGFFPNVFDQIQLFAIVSVYSHGEMMVIFKLTISMKVYTFMCFVKTKDWVVNA